MRDGFLGLTATLGVLMLMFSCGAPPPADKGPVVRFLGSPGVEPGTFPFSEAVQVGDLLFLSGQLGFVPGSRELAPGGISEETRQVMENIKAILERDGSSLDRVVKCTVFLADIGEWPAMNEVYRSYFPIDPPARSAVAANGLALDARVEIECIAAVGAQ